MSGQIFISYRRQESAWSARSLHARLCRDFDPIQIFMGLDAIALGEDFIEAIETTVARCDVLIAVIGNNWLTSKDERGGRRLDNVDDFVRMEIGTALKRRIRVVPVLVDGALMPPADDLPEDLKALVRRNALAITATSFEGDCQRLAGAIRQVLEKATAEERERLAAEQRQREEKQRLEAEAREEEERLEKERLEAEQREKERPAAEKRNNQVQRGPVTWALGSAVLFRGMPASEIPLGSQLILGRSAEVDVLLNDPWVSRRHAMVETADNGYRILDLHSKSGSFVNGRRFDEHDLVIGDQIQIGPFYFAYDGKRLIRLRQLE